MGSPVEMYIRQLHTKYECVGGSGLPVSFRRQGHKEEWWEAGRGQGKDHNWVTAELNHSLMPGNVPDARV